MTCYTPDLLAADADELTAIRRDIHRHPETAFEEVRTGQIVADKLTSWGIEIHRGLAGERVGGGKQRRQTAQAQSTEERCHG